MCRPQNVDWEKQGRDPQGSSGVFCQQLSCLAQGHTTPEALPMQPMVMAIRSSQLLPPKAS